MEGLETDLADTVTDQAVACPDGLVQQPQLSTGTAWDNYDENNDTLSGAGTLHDTFGVTYQNIEEPNDQPVQPPHQAAQETHVKDKKRLKRKFEYVEAELQPYRKKAHIREFIYAITQLQHKPPNFMYNLNLDTLWMVSTILFDDCPMWVGWNSWLHTDPLPKQRVLYLENIGLPPTRHDVIVKTLETSQRIAAECGDDIAVVTYDLAIAKPALTIQAQESPRFDKQIYQLWCIPYPNGLLPSNWSYYRWIRGTTDPS